MSSLSIALIILPVSLAEKVAAAEALTVAVVVVNKRYSGRIDGVPVRPVNP